MELQTSYSNALETVGRMTVHAYMLEKEIIHLREKNSALLERNKWDKDWIRQNSEKKSVDDFVYPRTAVEAGHITRQSNAWVDDDDTATDTIKPRRSNRGKGSA